MRVAMPPKTPPKARRTAKRASRPRKAAARPPKGAAKAGKSARRPATGKAAGSRAPRAPPTAGDDWRVQTLEHVRALIRQADPDAVEETKWRKASNAMAGVPVWSHDGMICTGETYKDVVKLTFAHGAALGDPRKLFNAGFGGGTRRAIDLREGDRLDATAFGDLIREAVAFNQAKRAG